MIVGTYRIWVTGEEFNHLCFTMTVLGEDVYRGNSATTWRFDTSLNWGSRLCMNTYNAKDPHWLRVREVAFMLGGQKYDVRVNYDEECKA